ncbi:MAG: hypothetical protein HQL53_00495 [Magnetococcales bacterium]|nr:hypothetical protein [Magnetococcales bacterium]
MADHKHQNRTKSAQQANSGSTRPEKGTRIPELVHLLGKGRPMEEQILDPANPNLMTEKQGGR